MEDKKTMTIFGLDLAIPEKGPTPPIYVTPEEFVELCINCDKNEQQRVS